MKKRTLKRYIFLIVLSVFFFKGFAAGIKTPPPQHTIKFTENKGQWDKKILYRTPLDGGVLFLEKNCFTYNFYDKETLRENHVVNTKNKALHSSGAIRSHAFRVTFLNSKENPEISSKQVTHDYCNFFLGNDKSKWVGNVKNFIEVNYQNIYDGIDMQLLGLQNSLKYNFIVAPHANPDEIKLHYEGIDNILIEKKSLRIKTSLNELVEQKPYSYQWIEGKKVEVPCEFVLENSTVCFRFPRGYNKNAELVIDPVLVFACSSGSTADNFGMAATYDANGNLYGGGTCFEQGYPVTTGAYDPTYSGGAFNGTTDVVITKYDSSGVFLHYSTYIGGSVGTEIVSSLIVNSQNELMLFGATGSGDFPVTPNAFDTNFGGGPYLSFPFNGTEYLNGTDLYVTKFNSTGTALLASSFIGGSDNDGANNSNTLAYNYGDYYRGEIQVDSMGNCYVASCTYSTNFPTTTGCSQPAAGGGMDGVVFKMDADLTTLLWSTYLGGNADDGCYALTLDNSLTIFTTGGTSSANFPTTSGGISTGYNGGITDGFVTKIKNDGSAFLKSTFIGTAFYDQSFLIQIDNDGNIFIVGQSEGTMPVSIGAYSNPNSKQFIWKMDSNLTTPLITTVFGNGNGQVNISPSAFLVDVCGNIYVCGWGGDILAGIPTSNMPLTSNAFQSTTDGYNFYLLVLTENANSLFYGTYFGGGLSREHVDGGTSRFDKKGIVYQAVCSGCGGNDDFPVTPGSWPNTGTNVNHSTNCNMGVFKFDFQAAGVAAHAGTATNDTICVGTSVNFINTSTNAVNYLWDFGDGTPISTLNAPNHQYSSPGTYEVALAAIDTTGCVFSDTAHLSIVVLPVPKVNLGTDTTICQSINMVLTAGTSGTTYMWSTGSTSQSITVTAAGTYWAIVSNGICQDTDTISIQKATKPHLGNDTTLCAGQNVTLNSPVGGISYLWSTGATAQNITVSTAGQYWLTVNYPACQSKDTVNVNFVAYPIVNLPDSLHLCSGSTILLNAGTNSGSTFLWSTAETSQAITVGTPGRYSVTVSNGHCTAQDSTIVNGITAIGWEKQMTLCSEKYTLDAGVAGANYLWSTGATTQTIDIVEPGVYWVMMTKNACTLKDTISIDGNLGSGLLWFPNSFTPNSDRVNDFFTGKGENITYFDMMIFDRWGNMIFKTDRQDMGWDGRYKGNSVEQGLYVWKVKYRTKCNQEQLKFKIGHVNLIR